MTPLLQRIDHIHIYVSDRSAAEVWFRNVLGFARIEQFAFWAANGGPLMLADASGEINLALFERPAQSRHTTIAFAVTAQDFIAWREHLRGFSDLVATLEDHEVSWSLYFDDPDGNPYEITCYEYASLASLLREDHR